MYPVMMNILVRKFSLSDRNCIFGLLQGYPPYSNSCQIVLLATHADSQTVSMLATTSLPTGLYFMFFKYFLMVTFGCHYQ